MQRTILNFFTKTAGDTQQTNNKRSRFGCELQTESKREVIVISSDDENITVSTKTKISYSKRKRLKISQTKIKATTANAHSGDVGGHGISKLIKESSSTDSSAEILNENIATKTSKLTPEKEQLVHGQIDKADKHIPYYLNNFVLALNTVMNDSSDARLFEGNDASWIKKFLALSSAAQKLYVRLFHRKLAWLPISKVRYNDISDNIQAILDNLVEEGFLECSFYGVETRLSLSDTLDLLSAPSVKSLAKSLHISIVGDKGKIVHEILHLCKKQKSVFTTGKSVEKMTLSKATSLLGCCYKVSAEQKQVFNRIFLVFDVTKGMDDDAEYSLVGNSQPPYYGRNRQLSTILMADMGKVIYPSYEIKKSIPVFETRNELLEYEVAFRLLSDVISLTEKAEWLLALEICEAADTSWHSVSEQSGKRALMLPHFLRTFTASAVYTRIRSLQFEILQRVKRFEAASRILETLLKQKSFCVSRRGFWSERLALNLDQHLHKPEAALEVIKGALEDEYVRVGHVVNLVERARKIQDSNKAVNVDMDKTLEKQNIFKASEVVIVGRLLPKRMQTGQARFMKLNEDLSDGNEEVLLCSVEELALDHYRCCGFDQGIHGEGGTFTSFFCLLMWDIIFMSGIEDVFRTPYQTHPLDYNTDEFYLNRCGSIDERVNQISRWECDGFSAPETITNHWNTYKGVACVGMDWERFTSLQQALSLAECIGGEVLAGIMKILAKDPRHTRSGMPDLAVWNATAKKYKLVEVKGPGDRLFGNQKVWMHELVRLGANVEVCRVTAAASRNLKR